MTSTLHKSPKGKGASSKSTKKIKKLPEVPPPEAADSSSESEDSEGDDVDEEGMTRLMKALGDDGMDEFDRVQLNLALGEEDWSTDEEGEDAGSDSDEGSANAGVEDESDSHDEEFNADNEEKEEQGEDDSDEEPEEEQVALDEVDFVEEDTVPRQKIEIDDKIALERIRETIQLDPSFPWTETLVLSYPNTIDVDVNDDLNRELAFYKQALHGANAARALAAKHNFPFTRPADYFAEMVKSDSHMERIRQRLLDEAAGIKKSEDKRKEREGKKFGKQVQIEKLKEREKSKKDMEERLKGLKRKRKDILDNTQGGDDDAFDIAVEDAISERPAKRGRGGGGGRGGGLTRRSRDQKYGFGGPGKRSKSNTKESTDDFGSGPRGGRGSRGGGRGGSRGGRGGSRGGMGGRGGATKRLGKGRRIAARSKA